MKKHTFFLIALLACFINLNSLDFFSLRQDIVKNSWKKIAFFYLTPKITLDNMGYTNNIYAYEDNQIPDYKADFGGDIKVSTIVKNLFIFSLQALPFYSFYLENKDQRAFNYTLDFNGYTHLGRMTLNYNYKNSSNRRRPTFEFGAPVRINRNGHKVSLDMGNNKNFFINIFAQREEIKFEDSLYLGEYDLKYRLDRNDDFIGITLNKRIFTATFIFINYEYYQRSFLNLPSRNGIGRIISAGLQFPEVSSIKGRIGMGVNNFLPKETDYGEFFKLYGRGDLSVRFWRRFKLTIDYFLDYQFSFSDKETYFDTNKLGIGMDWYLSKKIKIGYYQSIGRMSFRKLTDGEIIRTDTINEYKISIAFRIHEDTGMGLFYSNFKGDSDSLEFVRNYNFIGGFISHDF